MPNPIEMQQDRLNDLAADIREGRAMQAVLTARVTKMERELERIRNEIIARGHDPHEKVTASFRLPRQRTMDDPVVASVIEEVWAEPEIEDERPDDGIRRGDQPGWRLALKLGGAIVVFMGVLGTAIILMLGGVGS